ncbi:MAG: cobalt ECF transporter T component CbiQ, partial [Chloroflexaceae bacterium]|nr:cobalt ECF transporter T component CbiQ [Chloroflexaceae bacterium]
MELWLDQYATVQSPVHRWEARCRFVGVLSLIIACAAINHIALLPFAVLIVGGYYLAARLPLSFLFTRLRYAGMFLLVMVAVVPFATGTTVFVQAGPLSIYQEGLAQAALIATRSGCILTLSLVLFGTAPFLITVRTMRALGVPALLVDMMLFFYRYLADTAALLTRRQHALRLRGMQTRRLDGRTLPTVAALTGSMLVQSFERSERVYHAMRVRGYGQAVAPPTNPPIHPADWLGLAATCCSRH